MSLFSSPPPILARMAHLDTRLAVRMSISPGEISSSVSTAMVPKYTTFLGTFVELNATY